MSSLKSLKGVLTSEDWHKKSIYQLKPGKPDSYMNRYDIDNDRNGRRMHNYMLLLLIHKHTLILYYIVIQLFQAI